MVVPVLDAAWLPLQESEPVPPLATQPVELPEAQVRLIVWPMAMLNGLAANVTVGGAGGAVSATVTIWLAVDVPPGPVQFS
jgi:hypothetical protein